MATDVLVVGNVAEDLVDGVWVPGGPSLYASHVARALGAKVTLLTTMTATFAADSLGGLDVVSIPAAVLPRYENTYGTGGSRSQLLHEIGEPIPLDAILTALDSTGARVVYFAPAYHELPPLNDITLPNVSAISVQGPLRSRNGLRVLPVTALEHIPDTLVSPAMWVFFSDEDAGSCEQGERLARLVTNRGANAIMTEGASGIIVYTPGAEPTSWPAIPARAVIDPTGAGDTFAISFLLHLAETGDERLAIRFALAASSLAVERRGVQNIPTRGAIESRAQLAGAA